MKIINLVKPAREKRKFSQSDLAYKVGVTPKYIDFIERGERTPSLLIAFRIANEVGEKLEDIFLLKKCTKST